MILVKKVRAAYKRGGLKPLLRAVLLTVQEQVFDLRYGVNTASLWETWDLPEGYDRGKYVRYGGSKIAPVRQIFGQIQPHSPGATFVDIGCGKGRILLLASHQPYRAVVGVDFDPRLCSIAEKNIRQYRSASQKCRSIEVHCADATSFQLPPGRLVLYLFNPFGAEIVQNFLDNLHASFVKDPREIWIVYHNPVHGALMKQCGFLVPVTHNQDFLVLKTPSQALKVA